jgi:hypothetical protein
MPRDTLWLMALLAACIGGGDKTTDTTDTSATSTSEACALAAEHRSCPECSSGDVTCTYGDTSVTAGSCGDCQARGLLYQTLCDAGVQDDRATIEAGTVCEPSPCVVWFDTCVDPCTPLCLHEHLVPTTTTCDLGCTDTALPDPGECVNDGFGCAFQ